MTYKYIQNYDFQCITNQTIQRYDLPGTPLNLSNDNYSPGTRVTLNFRITKSKPAVDSTNITF